MKHFIVTNVLELQYLFLVWAFLYKRAAPDQERPFVNTPTICIHSAHKKGRMNSHHIKTKTKLL